MIAFSNSKGIFEKSRLFGRIDMYCGVVTLLAPMYFESGRYDLVVQSLESTMLFLEDESRMDGLQLLSRALFNLGQLPEAFSYRMWEMALTLAEYGSESTDYARSILYYAQLLMALNQPRRAVVELERCVEIYRKIEPSNPNIATIQRILAMCPDGMWAAGQKEIYVKTKYRLCSFLECATIEEEMKHCMYCKNHYLCQTHEKLIMSDHAPVCPKYPDALWVERKLSTIVKCRRCRKKADLVHCSACKDVWYCGSECQKDDWVRHQQFCGKE